MAGINSPSSKHLLFCGYTRKSVVVKNDCNPGRFQLAQTSLLQVASCRWFDGYQNLEAHQFQHSSSGVEFSVPIYQSFDNPISQLNHCMINPNAIVARRWQINVQGCEPYWYPRTWVCRRVLEWTRFPWTITKYECYTLNEGGAIYQCFLNLASAVFGLACTSALRTLSLSVVNTENLKDDAQFRSNARRTVISTYLTAHLHPFWQSSVSKSFARRFRTNLLGASMARGEAWSNSNLAWSRTGMQPWRLTKSPSWLHKFYLVILANSIQQAHLLRRMINRKKEWMDA